jgi:hypothetical protein
MINFKESKMMENHGTMNGNHCISESGDQNDI